MEGPLDIENAIINSKVLNKLKASLSNPSVQTTILTARTQGDPVENFFKEIDRTDRWSVIMRYYILNDVHYNDEGNRLIADNFIENFDYNLNSSK